MVICILIHRSRESGVCAVLFFVDNILNATMRFGSGLSGAGGVLWRAGHHFLVLTGFFLLVKLLFDEYCCQSSQKIEHYFSEWSIPCCSDMGLDGYFMNVLDAFLHNGCQSWWYQQHRCPSILSCWCWQRLPDVSRNRLDIQILCRCFIRDVVLYGWIQTKVGCLLAIWRKFNWIIGGLCPRQ